MNKNKKTSGFALVELAIVLVIIGLLIGGIMITGSLMGTARTQTFVSQVQQYDLSVNTFSRKFGGLPGDSENMTGANPGNSNGYITDTDQEFEAVNSEIANFWPHLSLTGLSKVGGGDFSNSWASGDDLDGNMPKSRISNKAGIIAFGQTNMDGNFFFVSNCDAMTNTAVNCTDGIIDSDVFAVDSKIDDGIATTGDVLAFDGAVADMNADLVLANSANYDLSNSANESSMTIRMGTIMGERR